MLTEKRFLSIACAAAVVIFVGALVLAPVSVGPIDIGSAQAQTPSPSSNLPLVRVFTLENFVPEGPAGFSGNQIVFRIWLSAPSCARVTVDYATEDFAPDTFAAVAGEDYVGTSGTAVFEPGEEFIDVSVQILGDEDIEESEDFNFVLSNPSGAVIGGSVGRETDLVETFQKGESGGPSATGTIVDDDTPPVINMFGNDQEEGDSGIVPKELFTVYLSNPSDETVSVDFATVPAPTPSASPPPPPPATPGEDFFATNTTIFFSPGEESRDVPIPVVGDTVIEEDEQVFAEITNPSANASLGSFTTDASRIMDDDLPVVSISDAQAPEGDGTDSTTMNFTLSLSKPAVDTVVVEYSTQSGSATGVANGNSDYQEVGESSSPQSVTIAAGETDATIPITILGDDEPEDDEFFFVNITIASGTAETFDSGFGRILDNDQVRVSIGDVDQFEGDSGTTTFSFPVTLNRPHGTTINVDFSTFDDSAVAGEDYDATSGTLTFAPSETSKSIQVSVVGDPDPEPDEFFEVFLSNLQPVGPDVAFADAFANGIIRNDDTTSTCPSPSPDTGGGGGGGGGVPPEPTATATPSPSSSASPTVTATPSVSPTGPGQPPTAGCDPQTEICGTDGDDDLFISDGRLIAGPGNDRITITTNAETDFVFVDAGTGDDTIIVNVNAPAGDDQVIEVHGRCGRDLFIVNEVQGTGHVNLQLYGECDDDEFSLPPSLPSGAGAFIVGGDGGDLVSATNSAGPSGPALASRRAISPGLPGSGGYTIDGGNGDDEVIAGVASDLLLGGDGTDELDGAAGDDEIDGGEGANNSIAGGGGHDSIRSKGIGDRAVGGEGDDTIRSKGVEGRMVGGEGDDTIRSKGVEGRMVGGEGDDTIRSKGVDDRLIGGGGNDRIRSKGIAGRVSAGGGDDFIEGSEGADVVFGGSGNDTMRLLAGHDQAFGGSGNDVLDGGRGNDRLYGGPDHDTCFGGTGRNQLRSCES